MKFSLLSKSQREFWNYAKNEDFFGLKLKYAIWILPIPFLLWGFVLIGWALVWIGVL